MRRLLRIFLLIRMWRCPTPWRSPISSGRGYTAPDVLSSDDDLFFAPEAGRRYSTGGSIAARGGGTSLGTTPRRTARGAVRGGMSGTCSAALSASMTLDCWWLAPTAVPEPGNWFMGSIAEKIFRQAGRPVLTVGPTSRPAEERGRVQSDSSRDDFGEESWAAAFYAVSLAQEHRARLSLPTSWRRLMPGRMQWQRIPNPIPISDPPAAGTGPARY